MGPLASPVERHHAEIRSEVPILNARRPFLGRYIRTTYFPVRKRRWSQLRLLSLLFSRSSDIWGLDQHYL